MSRRFACCMKAHFQAMGRDVSTRGTTGLTNEIRREDSLPHAATLQVPESRCLSALGRSRDQPSSATARRWPGLLRSTSVTTSDSAFSADERYRPVQSPRGPCGAVLSVLDCCSPGTWGGGNPFVCSYISTVDTAALVAALDVGGVRVGVAPADAVDGVLVQRCCGSTSQQCDAPTGLPPPARGRQRSCRGLGGAPTRSLNWRSTHYSSHAKVSTVVDPLCCSQPLLKVNHD